ncbi:Restriction endonuclease [Nitrospira japonica]|uniref:Restriction endonuclease n=1 Tax=Nitrospira japonica TaxID=1325564 RepID=A0A1W1I4Y2_9BACT|nr:restriction endonuclease [Nitrospira japonica]SLM48087.1 Restriction endonuclease [Nitrospira japonica]
MADSTLNDTLRHFEAAEANLGKAEKVLCDIESAIPEGIVFGVNPEYEANCRSFNVLLSALPKIDGWKPTIAILELDEIAQNRLDALELGEVSCINNVEREIGAPTRQLREYRYRFNQKRRELIRDALIELIDAIDGNLRKLGKLLDEESPLNETIADPEFEQIKENAAQISALLGSSVPMPARWSDLHRHLHFGMLGDLQDIIKHDWPSVKAGLRKSLYGEREPVPVDVEDLGALVSKKPRGRVVTKLLWMHLTDEDFERLIFALISSEQQYENPEWLMKTNAPDRGRDLSVYRVYSDPLAGAVRHRVIIQCKHWQSKSVGPSEIATLKEQMKLWEPPRVDVHVIATSGRFSSDAVSIIERQNRSDSALRIEMWPESHLELLLASRPAIIAEFGLR